MVNVKKITWSVVIVLFSVLLTCMSKEVAGIDTISMRLIPLGVSCCYSIAIEILSLHARPLIDTDPRPVHGIFIKLQHTRNKDKQTQNQIKSLRSIDIRVYMPSRAVQQFRKLHHEKSSASSLYIVYTRVNVIFETYMMSLPSPPLPKTKPHGRSYRKWWGV